MTDPTVRYEELLRRAEADANVVGVVLSGSRVDPRFVTAHSDVDVYVVQNEPDAAAYPFLRGSGLETVTLTLVGFEHHARYGTPTYWNRPSFLFARLVLDKTLDGRVGRLLEAKRGLDAAEADALIRGAVDDYMNTLYRALKNARDGRALACRLDAAESIPPLLNLVFALEGRVRPFNKWLDHALAMAPLGFPDLVARITTVLDTGDADVQRALFRDIERRLRDRGYGALVDDWHPDLPFLRGGGDIPRTGRGRIPTAAMDAARALAIVRALDGAGATAWVHGGWGVDALLGRQTRPHDDLDLVVRLDEWDSVEHVLHHRGFVVAQGGPPANTVFLDAAGHQVDLHPVRIDDAGEARYVSESGDTWHLAAPDLAWTGRIDGIEIRCLSPEVEVASHAGYPLDADDHADVAALVARFGVSPP